MSNPANSFYHLDQIALTSLRVFQDTQVSHHDLLSNSKTFYSNRPKSDKLLAVIKKTDPFWGIGFSSIKGILLPAASESEGETKQPQEDAGWLWDDRDGRSTTGESADFGGVEGSVPDGHIVDPTAIAVGEGRSLSSDRKNAVEWIGCFTTGSRGGQDAVNPDLAVAETVLLEDEVLPYVNNCDAVDGKALSVSAATGLVEVDRAVAPWGVSLGTALAARCRWSAQPEGSTVAEGVVVLPEAHGEGIVNVEGIKVRARGCLGVGSVASRHKI